MRLRDKANELKIVLPDNVGDIVYSFRYQDAIAPTDHRHTTRGT